MSAPRQSWEVVTHWRDDLNRPWADTQTFNDRTAALKAFKEAKLNNHDVPDITIDVVERDERRFPTQLTSWTTTPVSPTPDTPLGKVIARLARKFKIVDG